MYIPDNYDQWEKHDAEQEAALKNLPVCSECYEHIQDEYCFDINDEYICENCMNKNHRKSVGDIVC